MVDEDGKEIAPRIVEAVAVASGNGITGKKSDLAKKVEARMAEEVEKCYAEGLADKPDVIRERMLSVRKSLLEGLQPR